MNSIFLLYSCNQWKEFSNMKLIMASTDEGKIIAQIKKEILDGNMKCDGADGEQGVNNFSEHNSDYNVLENGFVNCVTDGEVQ